MYKPYFLYSLIFILAISLFASTSRADYFDVYTNATATTNIRIFVTGTVYNSTNGGYANQSVTAVFNGTTNTTNTSGTGTFSLGFTTPATAGEYNMSITAVSTTKTISVFITPITSIAAAFLNPKPPFSANSSFTLNITLYNGSAYLSNYAPSLNVYAANGALQSWTIRNITNAVTHNGIITYNISIPDSASGTYVLSADRGAGTVIFSINSGYIIIVSTLSLSGETKSDFYPGNNITIVSKIRNTGGLASNATNISGVVVKPDGSTDTLSFIFGGSTGDYNASYRTNSSLTGSYEISIRANVGSMELEGSTVIRTEQLKVKLETQQDFFKEWGDSAAFQAGGPAGLNIIVTNLSDSSTIQGVMNGAAGKVNCSNIEVLSVKNAVNGSSINIDTVTNTTGTYMMTSVCRIQFTAPSDSGYYKITINVTVGSDLKATGTGYFSAQKYLLKPEAVSSLGGEMEFMTMLYPGENATFTISAYNLSSGSVVASTLIKNITILKIIPLEFITGSTDITNITYTVTYPTSTAVDPTVEVTLPDNQTGPFLIKMRANISGESVDGEAFYMAKYVMGFLSRGSMVMGGSEGGKSGGEAGGSCSGTQIFSGSVFQIKGTQSAASGVSFNNIIWARNEDTGQDISSCLTMTKNTSDTNGQIQMPIAFSSSCSFSGFYFMIFNVTYQGKTDAIPSGFQCKNFNFWISPDNWEKSSNASVQFNLSGATKMNDSTPVLNGTLSLSRLMNFNPGAGGEKILSPITAINSNLTNGTASITIYPQNFSLSSWPTGFMGSVWQLCDLSNTCDTSWGGFRVTAFDMRIESVNGMQRWQMWGQTLGNGQNVSMLIYAATNVSRDSGNYSGLGSTTTTTGFKVKSGKPWGGKLTDLNVLSAVLVSDNWSDERDTPNFYWWGEAGKEIWNVTVTLPSSAKKGENMLSVDVNNSNGQQTTDDVWFQIGTYNVRMPGEAWIEMQGYDYYTGEGGVNVNNVYSETRWDLLALNTTYGVWPAANTMISAMENLTIRYYGGSQPESRTNGIRVLVLQSKIAGNWTIVLNDTRSQSGGFNNITVLNVTANWSNVYIWSFEDSRRVKIINTSYTSSFGNWGGEYQKGFVFYMPYVVSTAGTSQPLTGVNVSVNGLIQQNDKGGYSGDMGGMGFKNKLVENTDYTVTPGVTDTRGIAFVKLNITTPGKLMVFWKIYNDQINDVARFSDGTSIAIRSFRAWGGIAKQKKNGANYVTTLRRYNNTDNAWNYTNSANKFIFNGTFTETADADFIQDSDARSFWMIYDPNTNVTVLNDEINMNQGANSLTPPYTIAYSVLNSTLYLQNVTLGVSGQTGVSAFRYSNNTFSDSDSVSLALFEWSFWSNWDRVNTTNQRTRAKVCAYGFDKAQTPKEGVSFYVEAESCNNGPCTSNNLTLYDPINGSVVSRTFTGPTGCSAVEISNPLGWSQGFTQLSVKLTDQNNNTEETWIGGVDYWSS